MRRRKVTLVTAPKVVLVRASLRNTSSAYLIDSVFAIIFQIIFCGFLESTSGTFLLVIVFLIYFLFVISFCSMLLLSPNGYESVGGALWYLQGDILFTVPVLSHKNLYVKGFPVCLVFSSLT